MSEWWSYRPEDFLLFSPRVYWRLFALHNEAVWPAQIVALAGLAVMAWLAAARPSGHGRWIAAGLAVAWAAAGWGFVWSRYATINWAAAYLAPLFAVEALALLVAAATGSLVLDRRGPAAAAGWTLIAAAASAPLLAPLAGRGWEAAEVFAVAPDPSAIATLGFLLLARGRLALLMLPIPVVWCLVSAATLATMAAAEAWLPLAAAAVAVVVPPASALRRLRRGRGPGGT